MFWQRVAFCKIMHKGFSVIHSKPLIDFSLIHLEEWGYFSSWYVYPGQQSSNHSSKIATWGSAFKKSWKAFVSISFFGRIFPFFPFELDFEKHLNGTLISSLCVYQKQPCSILLSSCIESTHLLLWSSISHIHSSAAYAPWKSLPFKRQLCVKIHPFLNWCIEQSGIVFDTRLCKVKLLLLLLFFNAKGVKCLIISGLNFFWLKTTLVLRSIDTLLLRSHCGQRLKFLLAIAAHWNIGFKRF